MSLKRPKLTMPFRVADTRSEPQIEVSAEQDERT
jgi:hypothetical protein